VGGGGRRRRGGRARAADLFDIDPSPHPPTLGGCAQSSVTSSTIAVTTPERPPFFMETGEPSARPLSSIDWEGGRAVGARARGGSPATPPHSTRPNLQGLVFGRRLGGGSGRVGSRRWRHRRQENRTPAALPAGAFLLFRRCRGARFGGHAARG
jgi:hypothetical protein